MKKAAAEENALCLAYLVSQSNQLLVDDLVLSAAARSGELVTMKLMCKEGDKVCV